MQDGLTEIVRRGANDAWKLALSNEQLAQFERYGELLVEWNAARMNLTRLTSPHDIAVKHFLDSLALLTMISLPEGARLIDVGTGPGLPGLALKIARPDLRVTLLDSTAKKLLFCRAVADDLNLSEVETIHARAEEAGKSPALAGQFDFAVARALAPLDRLLPWLAPFVKHRGRVVALKGAGIGEEMAAARSVARRLGLALHPPFAVPLPESAEPIVRQIVVGVRFLP